MLQRQRIEVRAALRRRKGNPRLVRLSMNVVTHDFLLFWAFARQIYPMDGGYCVPRKPHRIELMHPEKRVPRDGAASIT